MRLSKDDVLKKVALTTEEVEVAEWGGSLLVRGMTGKQRDMFERSMVVQRHGKVEVEAYNVRARLVALCVVDDDGKPVFTLDDAEALGELSAAALDRVYAVAARLSGLGDNDMEEMQADFGGTTGSSSSSA